MLEKIRRIFSYDEKATLFKKINQSIKKDGLFINSDYIINSKEEEVKIYSQYLQETKHIKELIHYDIPMSLKSEQTLLNSAGFKDIKMVFENKKTKIIVAKK